MEVKADKQDLGRLDSSNSSSRFMKMWCREEKMEWKREEPQRKLSSQ